MKKSICLVSVLLFLLGCASLPESKEPLDESIVKLHRAKEIQCDFTNVAIGLTEKGELEFEQFEEYEIYRLLINVSPRSDNVTIYEYEMPVEDGDTPRDAFTYKVRRKDYGISFIGDVEVLGKMAIATITILRIDDVSSGYAAVFSISFEREEYGTGFVMGYCKVIE